jgi:uncharacterized membrane protein
MDGPLFMDAVITPNRSLTPKGLTLLVCVVTAFDALLAFLFVRMGAAPIPFFLGAGLIAVCLALLASIRSGRTRERVQVSADDVRVMVEEGETARTVWISPTAFTRVSLAAVEADSALTLHVSDRVFPVAAALSRRERREFAAALSSAIARARAA